ncbi:MAG: hypothetical protein V7752_19175 [Halopseudomonas sp.]
MIIDSSSIQLSAKHQKFEVQETYRSQQLFIQQLDLASAKNFRPGVEGIGGGGSEAPASFRSLGSGFLPLLNDSSGRFRLTANNPVSEITNGSLSNSRNRLFQALFNALASRTHAVAEIDQQAVALDSASDETGSVSAGQASGPPQGRRPMIDVNVHVTEYYKETECSSFAACGTVQTADGESIEFNLNLEMSRSYESTLEYDRTEQVEFKDPLVVNFNGSAAELTEQKYEFDLDVDGVMDWISFTGENSGLLALDSNEDGVINDGSELFGAISGNGFADLAQYDDDGNGFIDEADSIFAELNIWSKLGGEDRLESLQDRNIGAIYLGSTETPFDLKDGDNQQQGRVRQSGIYLNEDGGVGTVQQIDMVV